MTLGDLLKRIDLDKDCDKMFILRDSNGGWTNVRFIIQDNEISIVADVTRPFSSDGGYQVPDAPPYEIGDDGFIDLVYCDHTLRKHVTCERDTNGEWRRTVRYI